MLASRFPFASPLRYPGGKTKLAPTVAAILDASGLGASSFPPLPPSTDFGGDGDRFLEVAFGVDLRRVGVRVT